MKRILTFVFSLSATVLMMAACSKSDSHSPTTPQSAKPEVKTEPESKTDSANAERNESATAVGNNKKAMSSSQLKSYKELVMKSLQEHQVECAFNNKDLELGQGLIAAFDLVTAGSYTNLEASPLVLSFSALPESNNRMDFTVTYEKGRVTVVNYQGYLCNSKGCEQETEATCKPVP